MAGLLSKVFVKVTEATKKRSAELQLLSRREKIAVLKLFYEEGWVDFTIEDLDYMFKTSPNSCFKFVSEGEMIGVTFALLMNNGVCYPSSSVISKRHRSSVKYHDVILRYSDYLRGLSSIEIIYATKWLVEIYRDAMGYKPIGTVSRYSLASIPPHSIEAPIGKLTDENMGAVAAFLEQTFKCERLSLLKHAIDNGFDCCVAGEGSTIIGFAMARDLPKHRQLGPVISQSPSVALALISWLMDRSQGKNVMIEGDEDRLPELLKSAGAVFEPEGTSMIKMFRGDETLRENDQNIHAIYSHYLS